MIRLNDHAVAWNGSVWREPVCGERQWADLVSEVCECFERGAFADVTAAQAALDLSLDEPLNEAELALCLRSRWPSADSAPVMFAYRGGRPLRTELLERRDALSVTPGLHLTSFAAVATRTDLLAFVSGVAERPAYVAAERGGLPRRIERGRRLSPRSPEATIRVSRARAALHDVALAEFASAEFAAVGELALTG